MTSQMDVRASLDELAARLPRFEHGTIDLPIGRVGFVDGMTLCIQYKEIILDRIYDFNTPEKTGWIIDCGANIGLSVYQFAKSHPGFQVTAFEADPTIFSVLKGNVNEWGLSNVVMENKAVTDYNGQANFLVEGGEGGHLSGGGSLVVPAVRLADLIIRDVDLLKLDVEGAEWDIMVDLQKSGCLKRIRHLIVEFHGWGRSNATLGKIISGLCEHGFAFTFPWSFCEPGLYGAAEPTPFPCAKDAKYIMFLHAWRQGD